MSSRHHAQQQRQEMRDSLLQNYRSGVLRSGEVLPPVRELAKRFDLSTTMAHSVLREMADEGLVQMRRGAGVYMGHLPEHTRSTFAAVFGEEITGFPEACTARDGFESEIARRAGNCATLSPVTPGLGSVLQNVAERKLKIAGTFLYPTYNEKLQSKTIEIVRALGGLPLVVHAIQPFQIQEHFPDLTVDTVIFDDLDAGAQAAHHLWQRGHRRIAFLGLHSVQTEATKYPWSLLREQGFRAAMKEVRGEECVFLPKGEASPSHDVHKQQEYGYQAAQELIPLLRIGQIKAVVCVNHLALEGMVRAAHDGRLPEAQWPAIVAFDDTSKDNHLLSVLRQPWDEIGRVAASTLWDRIFGNEAQREAPGREILVPMRLIARLSCAENYPTMAVADAFFAQL